MSFVFHEVAPPLSRHINFLYAARGSMPYGRDRIFPMPSTDLKFSFSDAWRVEERQGTAEQSIHRQSWCMGIWDRPHLVAWPEHTDFIGISFKPGGAAAFLGVPLVELANRVVSLDAIWGADAARIHQQLHEAAIPARQFALLEQVLLARLAENADPAGIVGHVVGRIMGDDAVPVSRLCDEVGISHKHLITLFGRMVGCTPKALARLCRFARLLHGIDVTMPIVWTSLAHAGDYFDQSHFIRDFQAYTGLSPSDYLRQRQQVHARAPDHAGLPWMLPAG
jgi:AraC-like DNA-binding protein